MKTREFKYTVICPSCKKTIIEGNHADGIMICSKCKRRYDVLLVAGALQMKELIQEYKAEKKKNI